MELCVRADVDDYFLYRDCRSGSEYMADILSEMRAKLMADVGKAMPLDEKFIISLHEKTSEDPMWAKTKLQLRCKLEPVPVHNVTMYREYKLVEVDALEIDAINCKNCAAPIKVGKLDLIGDTLVRCSYCGTYHTIRRRDGR